MFDTVILLTGTAERAVFPSVLLGHNPLLTVIPVETSAELGALSPDLLRRARLVAFVTPVVVPQTILAQLGYGAFNFHPGPPGYPGWAPAHFRAVRSGDGIRRDSSRHGRTGRCGPDHRRRDVCHFSRYPGPWSRRNGLCSPRALVLAQAKWLALNPESPPPLPLQWGDKKYFRSSYRTMCEIPLDIPRDELDRRIKVFGGNHFGISLTINLHGIAFRGVSAPSIQPTDGPRGSHSKPATVAAQEPDRD